MPNAVVEIDYRANASSVEAANASMARGIEKTGQAAHASTKKQISDLADLEKAATKAGTAGRAAIRARNQDLRSSRGFTGKSGDYIRDNFGAIGVVDPDEAALQKTQRRMRSMRRYYEIQQTQTPSAVRTREVLGTVRQQQAERRRQASRSNVSLATINDSYRQQERTQQARARQVRMDEMQEQQTQDAQQRAGHARDAAASTRFRHIQASERNASERRAMFTQRDVSPTDIAALSSGDPERRLTTNTRFRWRDGELPPNGPRPPRGPMRLPFDPISGAATMASRMMMGGGAVAGGLMLGHKMMSVNQEFIEKADNAAEAYDTLARSLNIQAGLTGAESTAARDRIQRIAMRSATDKGFTYATATQLASSGFSATEATGNSLNEMLKGVNAMPAPGGRKVDPVQLAEASAAYMTSQNMDKTGGNLRNVLAGVQNLYKSTNFQLSDFSELAGQADTMRGRMTMGEQFGAFSVLRDVGKTAEEATTALRNIAIRTQTTEGSPAKTAALATLGLKPEDIDMQGESFTDVLDRLAKAIEGKDAPKVTTALEEVFGERTLAGITRLIEDRGKVKDRAAAIGNVEQYEADATTMSTGSAAAKRRQELQAETWAKDHSQKDDLLKQELSQQALEQGGSPFGVWGRGALNWGLRGMGVERDTAAAMAFESFGGDGRLSEAKRTLGEKGVKLTPGISYQDANGNLVPDTRSYDSDLIWQREFDAKHRGDSYTPKAGTPQAAVLEELEAKRKAGLLRPVGQTNAARDFVGPVQPVAQVEAPSNNRGPGRELPERTRETALLEKIADGITLIAAGQGTPIVVRPSDRRAPGSNASLLSSTG